jgi:leader peptidase (prepilin peptidase)/N-methyltransferase
MIRSMGTIFAGLLGLAFGSFLNVCLSRWPGDESIIHPRSHCRDCDHTLAWWENVPLVSWLALRGRCRGCGTWIGLRYPLVELAIGVLWGDSAWRAFSLLLGHGLDFGSSGAYSTLIFALGTMILYWLLVALAVLDLENLWLPDWLTLPGILLGLILTLLQFTLASNPAFNKYGVFGVQEHLLPRFALQWILGILAAAGLMLLIRWTYWLIRRREGLGLGDAKLMALLAAWLGLPGALLSFALGIVLGATAAVCLLAAPRTYADAAAWALQKLPLGTFLCIGGIATALWGQQIMAIYMRLIGF